MAPGRSADVRVNWKSAGERSGPRTRVSNGEPFHVSPEEIRHESCGWELVKELLTLRNDIGFQPELMNRHLNPLRELIAGAPEPHRFFFIAAETQLALESYSNPPGRLAEKAGAALEAYNSLTTAGRNALHRSWRPSDLLDQALRDLLNPRRPRTLGSVAMLRGLLSVKECNCYRALDDQCLISTELLHSLETIDSAEPEHLVFYISSNIAARSETHGPTGTDDVLLELLDYPRECSARDVLVRFGLDRARLDRFIGELPKEEYSSHDSVPSSLLKLRNQMSKLLTPLDGKRIYEIRGKELLEHLRMRLPHLPESTAPDDYWIVPYYPKILEEDPDDPIWQTPIKMASVFPILNRPFEARYALASTIVLGVLHDEVDPRITDLAHEVMKWAHSLK